MKKIIIYLLAITFLLFNVNIVEAQTVEENKVIYFYSPTCATCQQVHPYIETLSNDVTVEEIAVTGEGLRLFNSYISTYEVESEFRSVPLLFAGNQYFHGTDIITAIEDGLVEQAAQEPLLEVQGTQSLGFFGILFGGLLDGFNPCAIAMLLLFISLLGFTENKQLLVIVSMTYISALFLSYFALGTVLFSFFGNLTDQLKFLSSFINWFILILCSVLFLLNFYDFIATRNEQYGKVKNQLPKAIQRINKKIIGKFSEILNNQHKSKFAIIPIVLLTFTLGVIISLTEFLCTGQIYLPIVLDLVQFSGTLDLRAILYLLIYNVMFVSPLIVIALISIKSRSTMTVSNIIREKMQIIKLFNSLLFLGIAIFYLFRIF